MKTAYSSYQGVKAFLAILLSCLLALGPGLITRVNAAPNQEQVRLADPAAATSGFHISGKTLLDANGNKFVMRGINHPHNWYSGQTSSFRNIKAKGANTIRVVLSNGHRFPKNSAADVANVINLCKTNKLVCILEVHDTTGYKDDAAASSLAETAAYWKEIKSVLIGQEAYVMINIGNEPWGNTGATGWVTDTKNAILELRNAGLHHTLIVDAPNWGQDWKFIMRDNAAGILASDPDANILFSVHMYGVFDTAAKIDSYMSAFTKANLPLIVGEFGYRTSNGGPDEDAILQKAKAYQIGTLAWSWSGNSNPVLDMVTRFDPNQETWWGDRIIHGADGICETSVEASVYGGSGTPTGCSTSQGATVRIGTQKIGDYPVLPQPSTIINTPNLVNGPVKVASTNGAGLFTSERVTAWNSFNEVMGYPANQLTTEYWFPWYDNRSMTTWVLVGNASSTQAAAVDIYIGGLRRGSYSIPVNGRVTPRFDLQTGPVRVVSTNGVKIFTSERALYNNAFNEVMGYPASQLTTDYWFPLYDNVSMTTWILVGNPTGSTAKVDIYIGGVKQASYSIPARGRVTPRFDIPVNGPVRVVSTNGVKIFTSERSLYGDSFNEVMGYPASQLTTDYWFPQYDNISMATWVLMANPSASTAKVDIYVGTAKTSYTLAAGQRITPRFPAVRAGPVHVISTNGVKIFSSQREVYGSSFNEVMGYPGNRLTSEYWFPWYDSTSMSTDILVGRP